jgi:hypothetical protein
MADSELCDDDCTTKRKGGVPKPGRLKDEALDRCHASLNEIRLAVTRVAVWRSMGSSHSHDKTPREVWLNAE